MQSQSTVLIKPSNVRWKILALICVASFISYLLRTNLSIVGETMMKDLGLTQLQLGMVLSAFAWGYAIFQFPGGIFGNSVGSRNAIAIIAALWGILTIVTGFVPSTLAVSSATILLILIVVRFLVGASHAPIFPVIGGAIADWFPVSRWGFPNGLSSTALTLGAAAAAPLMVWLMQSFGWRQSFFLTAPLGFLIAFVWWWYARDYPEQHRGVNQQELQLIEANRAEPCSMKEKGAWKRALTNRNVVLITISYFSMNYVFYLFFNWFFFI